MELLRFLEDDIPDEDRFQLLKRLLIVAATETISDRESIKPQQFMKLIKSLSSGATLVLVTAHRLSKNPPLKGDANGHADVDQWVQIIAKESGLGLHELVVNFEDELIQKRLLNERIFREKTHTTLTPHFRLTKLGFEICDMADNYEELEL